MKEILIKTKPHYPISLGCEILSTELKRILAGLNYSCCVLISDETVFSLYGEAVLANLAAEKNKVLTITIPPGEIEKTRETKTKIEDKLLAAGCGRDSVIIALGGGVVTDLSGFVAATFCRGVPCVYLPTTLLAMVDAAVGGKTAVNTPWGKNLIGAFYQPHAVIIDSCFLKSLSRSEKLQGMAEMLKHAIIADKYYFNKLEANWSYLLEGEEACLLEFIERSLTIKARVVAEDEREQGVRVILNFAHTVAHALESCSNYQLPHGLAVLFGIYVESCLSNHQGLLSAEELERIYKIVLSSAVTWSNYLPDADLAKIIKAMSYDKKAKAKIPYFVLIEALGQVKRESSRYTFKSNETALRHCLEQAWHALL